VRVVGDGKDVKFWEDHWVGDRQLEQQFSRLYHISEDKRKCVKEVGEWREGEWIWNFTWRRRFFVWEEEIFHNFIQVLQTNQPSQNSYDVRRKWKMDGSGGYTSQ